MINRKHRPNLEFEIDDKYYIIFTPSGALYEKDKMTRTIKRRQYIYDKAAKIMVINMIDGSKITIVTDGVDLTCPGHTIKKIKV